VKNCAQLNVTFSDREKLDSKKQLKRTVEKDLVHPKSVHSLGEKRTVVSSRISKKIWSIPGVCPVLKERKIEGASG